VEPRKTARRTLNQFAGIPGETEDHIRFLTEESNNEPVAQRKQRKHSYPLQNIHRLFFLFDRPTEAPAKGGLVFLSSTATAA
jgi:hypothetical protein